MDFAAFIEEFNKRDHFAVNNGVSIVELREGYAMVKLESREGMKNAYGILHGGVIFTVADTAAGVCAASFGTNKVTLNSSINFLSPAYPGVIYAKARIVRNGKRVSVCEVSVTDKDNTLIATGTFTMYGTDSIKK